MYNFIDCAAQASREQMCQMRTTHAQTISPIWSRRVSSFFYGSYGRFSKDVCGCQSTQTIATQKHTEGSKETHRPRQTDGQKHTHTHLGGRSATCWAHLGGSHNERGTGATHTQVSTRRKQMRLHVGSPLVRVKWASPSTSRLQNTLLDAVSPCFLPCRQCTLHPSF